MKTRAAIFATAGGGLFILARTALYYRRTDSLALALVLTMAVAFVIGIVELVRRAARAEALAHEVIALPVPATVDAVDKASPTLRSLLRARMAHAPMTTGSAPFAPYLVGLLVMLGLLGTFLGLFETLRGAGEALTSSADVESLRAGLALPMQGLTRSFGTSAAGVSASAMLGLAAALTRASEARFLHAFGVYASGALAPLTTQEKQRVALEQLATNGEAMPRAATALRDAVTQLASLEKTWGAAHATAVAETSRALKEALASVRGELRDAVVHAGSAAEKALAPLVTRAVEGSVAAVKDHVAEVALHLEADRDARRAVDAKESAREDERHARLLTDEKARADALGARWDEATRSLKETIAQSSANDAEARARFAAEETSRAASLGAQWDEATRALKEAIAGSTKREAEQRAQLVGEEKARAAALTAQWEEATRALKEAIAGSTKREAEQRAQFVSEEKARAAALTAQWEAATRALKEAIATGSAREEERDRDLAKATTELTGAAASAVDAARERLAIIGAQDVQRVTELASLLASLGAQSDAIGAATDRQLAAIEAMVVSVDDRARALEAKTQAQHVALLARMDDVLAAQSARAVELEAQITRAHATNAETVAKTLATSAEKVTGALTANAEKISGTLNANAERVSGTLASNAEKVVSTLATSAEKVSGTLASNAEKVSGTLASNAEKVVSTLAARAEDVATSLAASAESVSETLATNAEKVVATLATSAEKLAETHAAQASDVAATLAASAVKLVDAHATNADSLAVTLAAHVESLGTKVAETADVVRDAAALMQAGGGELSAVGEMFASAVDRQRDAAAQWLESLGAVEAAVQQAGESAAARALGEQLDRTRELFDGQLQFHRELLLQLHGTRATSVNDAPRERHDGDAPA